MNFCRNLIICTVICCASAEIFLDGSPSAAEKKALGEASARQFFPFIPLNIPIPRPAAPAPVVATPVAPPVAVPVPVPVVPPTPVATTLPNCPAKCCLKYCKDGDHCGPPVGPATTPDCKAKTPPTDSGKCYNPDTAGCAPTVCKIQPACQTNCGVVIDVINPSFCN